MLPAHPESWQYPWGWQGWRCRKALPSAQAPPRPTVVLCADHQSPRRAEVSAVRGTGWLLLQRHPRTPPQDLGSPHASHAAGGDHSSPETGQKSTATKCLFDGVRAGVRRPDPPSRSPFPAIMPEQGRQAPSSGKGETADPAPGRRGG